MRRTVRGQRGSGTGLAEYTIQKMTRSKLAFCKLQSNIEKFEKIATQYFLKKIGICLM